MLILHAVCVCVCVCTRAEKQWKEIYTNIINRALSDGIRDHFYFLFLLFYILKEVLLQMS